MKHLLDLLLVALALGLLLAVADTVREMWRQKRASKEFPGNEIHAIRGTLQELVVRIVALEMRMGERDARDSGLTGHAGTGHGQAGKLGEAGLGHDHKGSDDGP